MKTNHLSKSTRLKKMEKYAMKTNRLLIALLLLGALLFTGCSSKASVGALQTESQSVELGGAKSVRVEINLGAGNLELAGGAKKLLEAGFTYNVAKLAPEVEYKNGTLVIRQPNINGLPDLRGITDYRNEWGLRLNNQLPMDLSVEMGSGTSDLQLAGLSLTGLDVSLGAGENTVDLSGDWVHDLDVTIDAGAANVKVLLPKDVGARVKVEAGPHTVEATGLAQDGDVYTNAAYGVSAVTLQVDLEVGIGQINLEVEEDQTQGDLKTAMISGWLWHDLCESGKDGESAPTTTPEGCVQEESPLGNFHADGIFSNAEPLIEGVVVTLGEGTCPSTGLAKTSTTITDLSYSFSGLKAGIYCISIDPQSEPNFSIIRPGMWTFPETSQDVISATVSLAPGEYRGMVNFGWDYQFQP
jgi:hypothetical protein